MKKLLTDDPRRTAGHLRFAQRRARQGRASKLARLLGWHHSTVWRKLNGKSPITESDALAIQKAVEMADRQ